MTDRAPTTNNRSKGYNINLSLIMGQQPSLHTFISILKVVYHEMNVELELEVMESIPVTLLSVSLRPTKSQPGEGITNFLLSQSTKGFKRF